MDDERNNSSFCDVWFQNIVRNIWGAHKSNRIEPITFIPILKLMWISCRFHLKLIPKKNWIFELKLCGVNYSLALKFELVQNSYNCHLFTVRNFLLLVVSLFLWLWILHTLYDTMNGGFAKMCACIYMDPFNRNKSGIW